MRRLLICSAIVITLFAAAGRAVPQEGASPIRLRARTFTPVANVGPGLARASLARAGHLLVQFAAPITPRDMDALRKRGAQPLHYVPDHTVAIAAPPGFDPASVPNVRWAGDLLPSDKISRDTFADLSGVQPRFPFTIVEFHADVAPDTAATVLSSAGAIARAGPGLPATHALVATRRDAIERLASSDAVAWIYPAPERPDGAIRVCEGVLTPQGFVASYATIGDGWDGDGLGSAQLTYYLHAPSGDARVDDQTAVLRHALFEWSRYVDIRWTAAPRAHALRSVTIGWGPSDHGDGFPFPPDVLAHAFYPAPLVPESIAGDVHFHDAFEWSTSGRDGIDIHAVALHEIGHSLGLTHSSNPDAVMYPIYRGPVAGLSDDDIDAARGLYASAGNPASTRWTSAAIGPAVEGGVTVDGDRILMDATGTDIWGRADEMQFAWRHLDGDGDIVTRVDSLLAVHRWSKAGVMLRAHMGPSSPHAFMLVSGAKGLAFQRRRTEGGLSWHTDGGAGEAPVWLRLSRRGDRFEAFAAADDRRWRLIGSDVIDMPSRVSAGLAVTSHDPAATASASFSSTAILPAVPWTGTDVGAVTVAGSWRSFGDEVRVKASGADVWGRADQFTYVWQRLTGDGEIVARVASVEYAHAWSKAGVMIRTSLDPASPHAFMLVSAGKGLAFQRRIERDGVSYHTPGGTGQAPRWVRLTRRGDALTAYQSDDGVSWVFVGSDVIPMGETVFAGVAVTSHDAGKTCDAVFHGVALVESSAATSAPPG